MEIHTRLYGSMKKISEHTSFLAYRLYQGMVSLSHFNGSPVCVVYNDGPDRSVYGDPVTQGGTVAFNIMRADGNYVGHATVEGKANESGIYLRSGGE
jgi:molybdenum cofactor sulfurtransferase